MNSYEVMTKLMGDDNFVGNALVALRARQTEREVEFRVTNRNNARGFAKSDAKRGVAYAEQWLGMGELTPDQMRESRAFLMVYLNQLSDIFSGEEAQNLPEPGSKPELLIKKTFSGPMFAFRAKKAGKCGSCGKRIKRGDKIVWGPKGQGAHHVLCTGRFGELLEQYGQVGYNDAEIIESEGCWELWLFGKKRQMHGGGFISKMVKAYDRLVDAIAENSGVRVRQN